MSLSHLPRTERLQAIESVMALARAEGIRGMSGECGELAVAMKRVLFAGEAQIIAGLNTAFEKHGHLIGHFAVRIDDEEYGCLNLDERGIPVADDNIESWGMLDENDSEVAHQAQDLGFTLTQENAYEACLLEFDDDEDVLTNMPGSGLHNKVALLRLSMEKAGYAHLLTPEKSSRPKPR